MPRPGVVVRPKVQIVTGASPKHGRVHSLGMRFYKIDMASLLLLLFLIWIPVMVSSLDTKPGIRRIRDDLVDHPLYATLFQAVLF